MSKKSVPALPSQTQLVGDVVRATAEHLDPIFTAMIVVSDKETSISIDSPPEVAEAVKDVIEAAAATLTKMTGKHFTGSVEMRMLNRREKKE